MFFGMDDIQVECAKQRIQAYKDTIDLNFEKIKSLIEQMSDNYESNNSNKINNLIDDLNNTMNIINDNNDEYISVIDKSIIKYRNQAQQDKSEFEKLGE